MGDTEKQRNESIMYHKVDVEQYEFKGDDEKQDFEDENGTGSIDLAGSEDARMEMKIKQDNMGLKDKDRIISCGKENQTNCREAINIW